MVESYAIWRALIFGSELSLSVCNVLFEGDAQMLIHAIKDTEECYVRYGNIVEDIKQLLKGSSSWSISFIHREGNQIAHCLAKKGLSLTSEVIWLEEFHDVISHSVLSDILS